MAKVEFTKENMPKTREEFQRALKEVMARSNPIDDLLEMAVELHDYEREYNMTSADFYPRYQRGEFDDDTMHATMRWAMAYEQFTLVKALVEFPYDNAPHAKRVSE